MTKAKVALNNSKNNLKHPKDGSIHKKKQQKFKNTPTGKVSLINGTPSKLNGKQMSPKSSNGVMKSPKSPRSPKSPKLPKGGASGKNGVGEKKSPKGNKKEEEEDEDSEEDINEGISINEIVSGQEDEEDDDDSSDDEAVPDVFKTSLPDVTDESDVDFDVTAVENKGVKMFRGMGKMKQEAEQSDEEDDEEEDDDEEDEEDESKPVLGLSALLGDSIKDESGDEDFIGLENSEDDDDDDEDDDDDDEDEDESDDETVDESLNSSNVTSIDDDDEEEEDDDDEDGEDDDESSPDLTALLGTSLADDSDDNDFEADDDDNEDEDEDEDINNEEDDEEIPESKNKKKKKSASKSPEITAEEQAEQDARTIFIGNIPKEIKVQVLTKAFKKFGPIESVRLRGIIPEDPKMSLKVAAIKKKFHKKSSNICAFIVYKKEESVKKALVMNGKKFEGNYLRVDRTRRPNSSDKKKSVFLGNLPFTIEDNELWEAFKDCGRIESVRVIRHRHTGLGRGFGYINFETADGAVLALSLDGTDIANRKVRVQSCSSQETWKKQQQNPEKGGKRKHQSESESNDSPKKVKTENSESVERATHNSLNAERRTKKGNKRSQGDKQRAKATSASSKSDSSPQKFQGQIGGTKNKKQKQDKTSKKKKQMAAKLLAKPKKPSAK